MRTFHLPLPDDLHEALQREGTAEHRPATEILREALVGWLEVRRRQRLAAEIERFALAEAGGVLDIDPDLERASIDHVFAGESR